MSNINEWDEEPSKDEGDCCDCKHDSYCTGGCGWNLDNEYKFERKEENA